MNKYQQIPEHIVDFHDYTVIGAQKVLDELLFKREFSHVRIIVGKGIHSQEGPILKKFVKGYLQKKGVRYNPSKIQDGGEGALEVFLR